jgi:hypothetical protein
MRILRAGRTVDIGFTFDGNFPKGISKNGGGDMEFILPSGVVLTAFGPAVVPTVPVVSRPHSSNTPDQAESVVSENGALSD